MDANKPESSEEQKESWLAVCDNALAAGDTPLDAPAPLQRDVAFLRQLRQALEPASTAPSPATAAAPELPSIELGRFRIVRELGRGSFGIVYLAHDLQLNRAIALKVPRSEVLVTPDLRQRFQREGVPQRDWNIPTSCRSMRRAAAFIQLAMIHLMLNRLEPKETDAEFRYRRVA